MRPELWRGGGNFPPFVLGKISVAAPHRGSGSSAAEGGGGGGGGDALKHEANSRNQENWDENRRKASPMTGRENMPRLFVLTATVLLIISGLAWVRKDWYLKVSF